MCRAQRYHVHTMIQFRNFEREKKGWRQPSILILCVRDTGYLKVGMDKEAAQYLNVVTVTAGERRYQFGTFAHKKNAKSLYKLFWYVRIGVRTRSAMVRFSPEQQKGGD